MTRIYLSPPHMCGKELEFIKQAFDDNWIAPLGPQVEGFERELSSYIGVRSAAALSSGTAAIHLGLLALGVKPGDTVACSTFTFAGSAFPILYCGAEPVFIDSEDETWNISPTLLEQAFSKLKGEGRLPAALVLVELYGNPAKMKEIGEICQKFKVPILEDAAEALGASYAGKRLGSFGKIGVISFNGNKIITTSGGGAAVSDDEDLIKRIRFLSTQARDPAPHYEHSEIGFNYRMSSIVAAIGRGQLTVLDERVRQRRDNFARYKELLSSVKEIEFPKDLPNAISNRWLTTILLPNSAVRDRIIAALKAEDIESRPLWKPMHLQKVFKDARAFVDGTSERLFERGLCLPSGSGLTSYNQELINSIIFKATAVKI